MKRPRLSSRSSLFSNSPLYSSVLASVLIGLAGLMLSCSKPKVQQPKAEPSRPSDINVEVRDGGPLVVTTSAAEFQILPSGYLQATLLKDGKRLTLDEPGVGSTGGSDSVVHEGKELDFVPDFAQAKVLETYRQARPRKTRGDSGASAGASRSDDRAHAGGGGVRRLSQHRAGERAYKNVGTTDFQIDQVWMQQHRFNSQVAEGRRSPTTCGRFRDRATTGVKMMCRS